MAHREIWFVGAKTPEERDKVRQDIGLAYNAFRRLESILAVKVKDNSPTSDYDKASWPFFQADKNGYNRALTEVLQLLEQEAD